MRALATCAWCDWQQTVVAPTRAEVVERATEVIDGHNAAVGHKVKPGRKPRTGYRRGEPVQ